MKIPDLIVPAPLRKPAKPGQGSNGKGQAPADLKTSPPERPSDAQRATQQAKDAPAATLAWVDQRTGASGFLTGMLYRKVPKGTNWYYTLGSATLFAFIVQAVTGVFLAMFYTPSATQAYASISHINNDVFLGQFVHGMHKWGASVMVILVFLHMGRTFFFGAYKFPRELNWVIGVVLLILTMTMAFTGYCCPSISAPTGPRSSVSTSTARRQYSDPTSRDFLRGGPSLRRLHAGPLLLDPHAVGSGAIIALSGPTSISSSSWWTTAPPWVRADKPKVAVPAEQLDAGVKGNGPCSAWNLGWGARLQRAMS